MKYLIAILVSLLLPAQVLAAYSPDCIIQTATWDMASRGYTLTFEEPAQGTLGTTSWRKKVIVSDRLTIETQLHVLQHEWAHVLLKHQEKGAASRIPHEAKEVEAERAAGIAMSILNLDPGSYTTDSYVQRFRAGLTRHRVYESVLVGNTMASTVMSYCTPR